jgi:hypothetical protein
MTNLEIISEKTQTIRKNISAFENLKWVCSRLLNGYYQDNNLSMVEVMKERHGKVIQKLNELHSELIPIEKERIQLLGQQPKVTTHGTVDLNIKNYSNWMH